MAYRKMLFAFIIIHYELCVTRISFWEECRLFMLFIKVLRSLYNQYSSILFPPQIDRCSIKVNWEDENFMSRDNSLAQHWGLTLEVKDLCTWVTGRLNCSESFGGKWLVKWHSNLSSSFKTADSTFNLYRWWWAHLFLNAMVQSFGRLGSSFSGDSM